MAKSAISADVKSANSKLAQFLRRKEEEEQLLQIGKRKPKSVKEEKRAPTGRAKWMFEPDFRIPSCQVDRPRTLTGSTTFHFSVTSISKEAVPTFKGKPLAGALGRPKQPALDHAKYIERDGAAERSAGADHAAYVERPGAAERFDPSDLISEVIERNIAALINESPTEEEAAILGVKVGAQEGIPSVFSNISDDPFERMEYWRAVERCERTPRTHKLILDPEVSPAWWAALPDANNVDPAFKNHALLVLQKYKQHAAQPNPVRPFTPEAYTVTLEAAGRLIMQAMRVPGFDHSTPPLEFKSGRGGRVQIRFLAELPHELTPEDRALIAQNFCDHLANLEVRRDDNGKERQVGMMYTAVIHAPDAHNDARNYHLHIVAHDRPARYLPGYGMWDFEVQEHYIDFRKERIRYPFRQNKIGEVSQGTSKTGKEKSGKDFIPAMRAEFARITNTVLKARGVPRQIDPRKYTEMGIDRTPTEHLGTKAAALESIGVPTTVGQLNAIRIWNDAERAILRQAKQAERQYKASQQELIDLTAKATAVDPNHPALTELRVLMAERDELITHVAQDRLEIMSFDHLEAKAKSRAVRTRQTCLQFLTDIDNGTADHTTRFMKTAIEQRLQAAQNHISAIDQSLQLYRHALAADARTIERREKRIDEIDQAAEPLRTALEELIARTPAPRKNATRSAPAPRKPIEYSAPPAAAPDLTVTLGEDDGIMDVLDGHTNLAAQPITMEGRPIVEPTIAPTPAQSPSQTAEATPGVPEGLTPLRPPAPTENRSVPPETIVEDIAVDPSAPSLVSERKDATIAAAPSRAPADLASHAKEASPTPRDRAQEPSAAQGEGARNDPRAFGVQEATPYERSTTDGVQTASPSVAPEAAAPDHARTGSSASLEPHQPHRNSATGPAPTTPHAERSTTSGDQTQLPKSGQQEKSPAQAKAPSAPPVHPTPERAQGTDQSEQDPLPSVHSEESQIPTANSTEPSLIDLPKQVAPTKPGTSKATYEEWDALLKRIADLRIAIVRETDGAGQRAHSVSSLNEDEKAILYTNRFSNRTEARLAGIYEFQQREIERLVCWINEQGRNPELLIIEGRTVKIGPVRDAVRTLFKHWGRHPAINAAFAAEHRRRAELAKAQTPHKPAVQQPLVDGKTVEQRKVEAERLYPPPKVVRSHEVRRFITYLREGAPEQKLREAAYLISISPDALQDVRIYNVALINTYEKYAPETLPPAVDRNRGWERER